MNQKCLLTALVCSQTLDIVVFITLGILVCSDNELPPDSSGRDSTQQIAIDETELIHDQVGLFELYELMVNNVTMAFTLAAIKIVYMLYLAFYYFCGKHIIISRETPSYDQQR